MDDRFPGVGDGILPRTKKHAAGMFFASRWSAVLFESHHPEYPYKIRGYLKVSSVFMGWVMGFEPTNTGTTIRCLRPLGDTHHMKLR